MVDQQIAPSRAKPTRRPATAGRSAQKWAAPDVSIVVVHYETPRELRECLASVGAASSGVSSEIFVVDNASAGFVAEHVTTTLPGAMVLRNRENHGFAVAANQALRHANGRYLLLVNPDTVMAPDTLRRMVDYMDVRVAKCLVGGDGEAMVLAVA